MEQKLDLIIEPASSRFDENDERWSDQVNELLEDCKAEVGEVRKEVTAIEGQKGGFEEIFLLISSSKALELAFDVFKTWLFRDKTRSLNIKVKKGEEVIEFDLSGQGYKKEELEKYLMMAMKMQADKNG
ncbi:hypothetical protein [Maribellus sediminis]|uniref:hypothetical protein n=1 Tax=Maribellus sediminis TaxID=2696285 RepID=UPI0014307CBA|nr:hypothetical protein [Maribellus sediminis]